MAFYRKGAELPDWTGTEPTRGGVWGIRCHLGTTGDTRRIAGTTWNDGTGQSQSLSGWSAEYSGTRQWLGSSRAPVGGRLPPTRQSVVTVRLPPSAPAVGKCTMVCSRPPMRDHASSRETRCLAADRARVRVPRGDLHRLSARVRDRAGSCSRPGRDLQGPPFSSAARPLRPTERAAPWHAACWYRGQPCPSARDAWVLVPGRILHVLRTEELRTWHDAWLGWCSPLSS